MSGESRENMFWECTCLKGGVEQIGCWNLFAFSELNDDEWRATYAQRAQKQEGGEEI